MWEVKLTKIKLKMGENETGVIHFMSGKRMSGLFSKVVNGFRFDKVL